jgi:hypothetical protein
MARSATILRVFVASPSDVKEERELLEDIIKELNLVWAKEQGILLELVKWETHTYPGAGADPQSIINEQLSDDYDIFIGVMWARFGTPTGRAGSGTVEEFRRAYNSFVQNPNRIRIMFYFKNAPIAPNEIDIEQLSQVNAFKKELGGEGVYYWLYNDERDFSQFLRMHIGRQVQSWGKSWGKETEELNEGSVSIKDGNGQLTLLAGEIELTTDDEGFLDLMVMGEEKFEALTEVALRMTTALNNLGEKVSSCAQEINQEVTINGKIEAKHAKRISNRAAAEMNHFATLMESDVPVFANSYSGAIESYTRAFSISKELRTEKREDLESAKASLHEFKGTLESTKTQMASFRQTIAELPRMTTELNRAKRRVLSIMDKFDAELNTALNLSSELDKTIDQLVETQ